MVTKHLRPKIDFVFVSSDLQQCRFGPGCGKVDQLFTLAGLLRGSWEFDQSLVLSCGF